MSGWMDVLQAAGNPLSLPAKWAGTAVTNATQGKPVLSGTPFGVAGGGPPPAPDYMNLAGLQAETGQQNVGAQTAANRPDQVDPFGNSVTWTHPGADPIKSKFSGGFKGDQNQWVQTTKLGDQAQGFADQIKNQGALNFASLPELGNGQDAMQQAQNAAYQQQTSRLDPKWNQSGEALRTQLLNQGLDPSSEAYGNAMSEFGRDRNDAYQGAMNNSIGLGNAAAQQQFGMNLGARQQLGGERAAEHQTPFSDLSAFMPKFQGFNAAGVAPTPDLLGAAGAADASGTGRYNAEQQRIIDLITGLGGIAGKAIKPGGG